MVDITRVIHMMMHSFLMCTVKYFFQNVKNRLNSAQTATCIQYTHYYSNDDHLFSR